MKTIIAGGRHYSLSQDDCVALKDLDITEVVSGRQRGADEGGEQWAAVNRIPLKYFEPDWRRLGSRAGPFRNAEMAAYADAVVLFPGGKGTESMFQEARKAGITIYDWRESIAALNRLAASPSEDSD